MTNQEIRKLTNEEIIAKIDECKEELFNLKFSQATGNLENFKTNTKFDGKWFEVTFDLPTYWKYLENGRKAGKMPPVDAILKWIQTKPIVPQTISGTVPSPKQVAFMIARKIGRDGTQPTKLLQNTIDTPQTDNLINQLCDLLINQIENEINEEEML